MRNPATARPGRAGTRQQIVMEPAVIQGVRTALAAMRTARDELARAEGFVSTSEAVRLCPFAVSEDTLLAYPEYVLPRRAKNPRAKRKTYLWDPQDLRALPVVLKQWERAIDGGSADEENFMRERLSQLEARDLRAMEIFGAKEAA